jgi:hypothetical protein
MQYPTLVMRDELIRIVERQLDRKLTAFMSQSHIHPDLAVEVFVLPSSASNELCRSPAEAAPATAH